MKPTKPVILTDIDGVAVSWQSNLPFFAAEHNLPTERIVEMIVTEEFLPPHELFNCSPMVGVELLKKYNKSKWIRGLKGYKDALIYINKLKEHYDFVAVTALGRDFDSSMNRMSNLNVLFPNAFKEVMMCEYNESKVKLFEEARHRFKDIVMFADDRFDHCVDAIEELKDIKVFHMVRTEQRDTEEHNWHGIRRVTSWKEIYETLQNDQAH